MSRVAKALRCSECGCEELDVFLVHEPDGVSRYGFRCEGCGAIDQYERYGEYVDWEPEGPEE